MQYTVNGFQQEELVRLGLDLVDTFIIRWFVDFQATGKMKKYSVDDTDFYLITYNYIIKQIPIIGIKNKEALGRRFKKICDTGLMEKYLKKDSSGTYTYYRLVPGAYERLISKPDDSDLQQNTDYDDIQIFLNNDPEPTQHTEKITATDSKVDQQQTFESIRTRPKSRTKDSSNIDSSNIDSILADEIRKYFFAVFSDEYKKLYGERLIFHGKEEGCIKHIVKFVMNNYPDNLCLDIVKKKTEVLLAVARNKNKYQNWQFLPSQLQFRWNDLHPGCIMEPGGHGKSMSIDDRKSEWAARAQRLGGKS